MTLIKKYYQLAKPGIVYGNLLSAIAGFLLASKGHLNLSLFVFSMLGIALVIGSACVLNNYTDRERDKKMKRTKYRSLAIGEIPGINAVVYGAILGILGFSSLFFFTNYLTMFLGIIGYFVYVIFYAISKRTTIYNTLIGSISGAMPIAAGYTAVTNRFDMGALILFLILVFWQMPHFYSIAMYRLKDYTEAEFVVWPVKKGMQSTKIQTLIYVIAFIIASLFLYTTHYAGLLYLAVVAVIGVVWMYMSIQGFRVEDNTKWARQMFFFSLISLLTICAAISVTYV